MSIGGDADVRSSLFSCHAFVDVRKNVRQKSAVHRSGIDFQIREDIELMDFRIGKMPLHEFEDVVL